MKIQLGALLRRAVLPAVAAATLLGLTAAPAAAMDGRVPDSRQASATGEITALYWHGLNRDPDPGGLSSYTGFASKDCRWGVLHASFTILNSGEAHAVWRDDPQTLAGMLYASLLNRAADQGGIATYTAAVRERGLPWATTAMLASAEYNARLDRLCAGSGTTATVYDWQSAQSFAQDVLLSRAEDQAIACGVTTAVRQGLAQLRKTKYPPAVAVGRVAGITNTIISKGKLDGTCGSAIAFLKATLRVNELIGGDAANPVFVEWYVGNKGIVNGGQRLWIVRVGPNPTSWEPFTGHAF